MSSSSTTHAFLFNSLGSTAPTSVRKVHIKRLYDVLQLCIHRNDIHRARRAWAILARCNEIDWMTIWTTGLHLISDDPAGRTPASQKESLEFLRAMILQHSGDREAILQELILRLILAGKHREALDELELYLPSFPFQDNPVLHIYAGLISLYLSQRQRALFNPSTLRDAEGHFERAKALDPTNVVAAGFLEQIPTLAQGYTNHVDSITTNVEDEDADDTPPVRKRARAST